MKKELTLFRILDIILSVFIGFTGYVCFIISIAYSINNDNTLLYITYAFPVFALINFVSMFFIKKCSLFTIITFVISTLSTLAFYIYLSFYSDKLIVLIILISILVIFIATTLTIAIKIRKNIKNNTQVVS